MLIIEPQFIVRFVGRKILCDIYIYIVFLSLFPPYRVETIFYTIYTL